VSDGPRNSRTEWSSNAAAISRNASASTRRTSTPAISIPNDGCSGRISSAIGVVPLGLTMIVATMIGEGGVLAQMRD
jgi:hypothetical protein